MADNCHDLRDRLGPLTGTVAPPCTSLVYLVPDLFDATMPTLMQVPQYYRYRYLPIRRDFLVDAVLRFLTNNNRSLRSHSEQREPHGQTLPSAHNQQPHPNHRGGELFQTKFSPDTTLKSFCA
jgi:hypothetical protein